MPIKQPVDSRVLESSKSWRYKWRTVEERLINFNDIRPEVGWIRHLERLEVEEDGGEVFRDDVGRICIWNVDNIINGTFSCIGWLPGQESYRMLMSCYRRMSHCILSFRDGGS